MLRPLTLYCMLQRVCLSAYLSRNQVTGLFHHSSMTRGHCVKFAGALSVADGKLTMLSPHSGHYIPTQAEYDALQSMLRAKGVDLSLTDVRDMIKSK